MAKPLLKRSLESQMSEKPGFCRASGEGRRRPRFSFTLEQLNQRLYERKQVQVEEVPNENKRKKMKGDRAPPGYAGCQKSDQDASQSAQPSYAIQSFPDAVRLCHSCLPGEGYGVCAKQNIPVGTWIGPYEGKRVRPEEVTPETDTSYMWEIFHNGRLLYYLDAINENTSSWMRFIRSARCKEEQNMYCFQYCGNIYYRAFKEIPVGTELLVWYDEAYPLYFGIPLGIHDLHKNGNKTVAAPPQASYQPLAHNVPRHPAPSATRQEHTLKQNGTADAAHEVSQFHGSHLPHSVSHSAFPTSSPPTHQAPVKSPQSPPASLPRGHPSRSRVGFIEDAAAPVNSFCNSNAGPDVLPSHRVDPRKPHPCPGGVGEAEWTTSEVSDSSSLSRKQRSTAYSDWKQEGTFEFEGGVWKCGQCGKTFLQRALLQVHVCSRMPRKPYQCGHCCQSFNHPNELRTHAVVHSGKKPFKCGYCARTFAGATTLNNHVRTHTGERPFTCEKCCKTFSQATQLSRHKKCVFECAEEN